MLPPSLTYSSSIALTPARTRPRYDCSRLLGSDCPCLTRWQTPSDSLTCRVCGESLGRGRDRRHIKSKHAEPNFMCCPHPACDWRGSRKKALDKHMKDNNCGPKPTLEGQYMIYDTELILSLTDPLSFETVEEYVLGFIEEKAIELEKVAAWGPLTEWRKPVPPVLVVELGFDGRTRKAMTLAGLLYL